MQKRQGPPQEQRKEASNETAQLFASSRPPAAFFDVLNEPGTGSKVQQALAAYSHAIDDSPSDNIPLAQQYFGNHGQYNPQPRYAI
ncbi:MAG: hypothetical protein SGCHY_003070 [Lobulomycetales sp.]